MWLDRNEKAKLFKRGNDRLACLEAIHAGKRRWGVGNDARRLIEDCWRRQVVPQSNFAVVRIVGWGDLHCASAEAHLDKRIGNHWNGAVHERHHDALSNECGVARIVGVHGHAGIAEERLRSCRCDYDTARGVAPL